MIEKIAFIFFSVIVITCILFLIALCIILIYNIRHNIKWLIQYFKK